LHPPTHPSGKYQSSSQHPVEFGVHERLTEQRWLLVCRFRLRPATRSAPPHSALLPCEASEPFPSTHSPQALVAGQLCTRQHGYMHTERRAGWCTRRHGYGHTERCAGWRSQQGSEVSVAGRQLDCQHVPTRLPAGYEPLGERASGSWPIARASQPTVGHRESEPADGGSPGDEGSESRGARASK
jgi:hypothetical protein